MIKFWKSYKNKEVYDIKQKRHGVLKEVVSSPIITYPIYIEYEDETGRSYSLDAASRYLILKEWSKGK